MMLVELLFWMIRFIFGSIFQLIATPFILMSDSSSEIKVEAITRALVSVPIIIGAWLLIKGSYIIGVILILAVMVFSALVVSDDGSLS